MRTADVLAYFGTQKAVADALGIKSPSVAGWGETVPKLRQLQIERITAGKLKAAPDVFETKRPAQEAA